MVAKKISIDKKSLFTGIIFCMCFSTIIAQGNGIRFEKYFTWQNILAKAKTENKYIFVDCFTTWCGPCKYMDKTIFPMEKVGDLFNKRFINVKLQLDTTKNDVEEIKMQYADAAFIKNKYKIMGYPTFLFFNSDGELVDRAFGSSDADDFISKGNNALDSNKQYYTQIKKYEAGERDSAFLKNLTLLAVHALDEIATSKYAKDYLTTQSDLLSNDNIQFIYTSTRKSTDTGFILMMNNLQKFEKVINKKDLYGLLEMIIIRSQFLNINDWNKWNVQKWQLYRKKIQNQYPLFADEVLLQIKTDFYQNKKDWNGYIKAVDEYALSKHPSPQELNDCAWTVFRNSNQKKELEESLIWSKKSFINQTKIEPGFIDTYANILYKLNRKNEALEWEKKAQKIAIEQGQDKNWGQEVIDKIKKGEKTW